MNSFNPTRRNRNIGTAAQGHGDDNRLVIPHPQTDRIYWESVTSFEHESHRIHNIPIAFVIERITPGWRHPCSVLDVRRMLELVPINDLAQIKCFLFRQPTRKQILLNPAWGRLTYFASLGAPDKPDFYSGPMITLEACEEETLLKWPKSLSSAAQTELERLRSDGHTVTMQGRNFLIKSTGAAIRRTQLYRTLLHEIGHWVDYLQKVERPSEIEPNRWEQLNALYFARPSSEREAFAHRYGETLNSKLREARLIPF